MDRTNADGPDLVNENVRLRARVAELEQSAGFADAILAGLPGLVVILDEEGRFVESPRRNYQMILGHPPQNRQTASGFPDVHPDDQAAVALALRDALAGLEGAAEARVLTREGPRWYAFRGRSCEIGGRRYVVASGTDIEQAKQSEAALRIALRRLEMLARMSASTVGFASVSDVARRLAADVRETFAVDACIIRAFDGDDLLLIAADGVPASVLAERMPYFGIARRMVETRSPIAIRDVREDPVTREAARRRAGSYEFVSYAGAPMMAGDNPIGVLGVYTCREPRDFTETDTEHLSIVANHVATTLRNEMLYKTVQNQEAALRNAARDLERRVEERTASLAEAVGELEAFTYTVSHDLRAPIRAIMGFASLLEEDLGRPVPPEVARQTAMIKDSAARMGRLVDDLLAFSRAGRRPLAVQPVEPGQLVASVLGEAEPEMAGRDIEVRIGDLPPCQADPGLLRQVYHNLISNALKYTRKRDHPVIEIGHGRSDNEWAYFVRDNGMGLDMRYAGRIFGVFQRLHTDEEFEGTGVGLAHVQRIVTRHGGRVWVESEPDRGATFWFTISR